MACSWIFSTWWSFVLSRHSIHSRRAEGNLSNQCTRDFVVLERNESASGVTLFFLSLSFFFSFSICRLDCYCWPWFWLPQQHFVCFENFHSFLELKKTTEPFLLTLPKQTPIIVCLWMRNQMNFVAHAFKNVIFWDAKFRIPFSWVKSSKIRFQRIARIKNKLFF